MNKRNNILGPYWADVTCQADDSLYLVPGRKYALANLTFYDCGEHGYDRCCFLPKLTLVSNIETPTVHISPERVEVAEGSSFELSCTATGSPIPEIFWNTSMLNSNYTLLQTTRSQVDYNLADDYDDGGGGGRGSGGGRHRRRLLPTPQPLPLFRVIQVLRIEKVNIDDNEHVYCRAENDVGKSVAQVPINVLCKFVCFRIYAFLCF